MLNAQMCNCIVKWKNPPWDVDDTIIGQIIISSTPRGAVPLHPMLLRPVAFSVSHRVSVPHLTLSPYLMYMHRTRVRCILSDY